MSLWERFMRPELYALRKKMKHDTVARRKLELAGMPDKISQVSDDENRIGEMLMDFYDLMNITLKQIPPWELTKGHALSHRITIKYNDEKFPSLKLVNDEYMDELERLRKKVKRLEKTEDRITEDITIIKLRIAGMPKRIADAHADQTEICELLMVFYDLMSKLLEKIPTSELIKGCFLSERYELKFDEEQIPRIKLVNSNYMNEISMLRKKIKQLEGKQE